MSILMQILILLTPIGALINVVMLSKPFLHLKKINKNSVLSRLKINKTSCV
jgi:hypothetical protein